MSDETAPSSPAPTQVTIECGCNFTRESKSVSAEPRYSVGGMLTLIFGVTARPKKVDFMCLKCGKIIDRSFDAAVIKKHTF